MADALQIYVVEREPLIALDIERTLLALFSERAEVTLLRPGDLLGRIDDGLQIHLLVCDADCGPEILAAGERLAAAAGAVLVFTTAADILDSVQEGPDLHRWPVVWKPFSPDDLARAVRRALARGPGSVSSPGGAGEH